MRKFFLGILFLLLIFNLQKVGIARAEFIDDEKSVDNILNTGTLDFAISAGDYSPLPLTPGVPATRSASIINNGSLSFNYDIHTVQTGGSSDFCNALNLEARLGGVTKYNGSLLSFSLSPAVLFGGSDSWDFTVRFDDNSESLKNQTCDFNFIFKGWQTDSDGTWGFWDEEVLGNIVTSGTWVVAPTPTPGAGSVVINEVYYDVKDGGSKGTENKNEWIELYNNSDSDVPLKNWSLVDGAGHIKTINPTVSILTKSFIVLSHDATTWNTYWTLPAGIDSINLTGNLAWLNNDGDKLILKDPSNNEIDWVAWENYVNGWNITAGDGESIARKVKGVDTDSVNDWNVLTSPNPGTNPHPPVPVPTPVLEFSLRDDKKAVSFAVSNINSFNKISYEIVYDSSNGEKGIAGSADLTGENTFSRTGLLLGTCSEFEGKVCVYDEGITKLHCKVTLDGPNQIILEKEIDY